MTRTLFVSAGSIEWGSSRIRAFWPARYMDAAVITFNEHVEKMKPPFSEKDLEWYRSFDVIIFQKTFDFTFADIVATDKQKIIMDACDPAWWWEPESTRRIDKRVDAFTFSTSALAQDFSEWSGSSNELFVIPDRLDLREYPVKREHVQSDVTRFIWFGLSANRFAVNAAIPYLERLHADGHKISLTIFDDRPDAQSFAARFPVYYSQWSLEKENATIASHDVAILPKYPGPWGKVKSNNRVLTAWACGLPVASGDDYNAMKLLTEASVRKEWVASAKECLAEFYDVQLTANELERVFEKIGVQK